MKKNSMMRVAVLMLALVLMTSCFVGGTFAKYTTGGDGAAHARVAHWGVTVEMQGDPLFKNEYTNAANALIVESSSDDVIVAPGTSGKTTFSISGKPEVATEISIEIKNVKDVHLGEYYPLHWKLTLVSDASQNVSNVLLAEGELADIVKFLNEEYMPDAKYAPNENLGAIFELSWEWTFENGVGQNNDKDSDLGDLAANGGADDENNCTIINYEIHITVDQVED